MRWNNVYLKGGLIGIWNVKSDSIESLVLTGFLEEETY